jgi:hypothetical protein
MVLTFGYFRVIIIIEKRKGDSKMTAIKRRTREEMLTEVIQMFGFEDERTLDFAWKCELWEDTNFNNDRLEGIIAKYYTQLWFADDDE